jgi:arginine decarboxylase
MKKTRRESRWTTDDSSDLYGIATWGRDYFSVNDKGHLTVGPGGEPGVDLKELVDEVAERGIAPPILIRFSDLLKTRLTEIHGAFHRAIQDYDYKSDYRGVYPIKVNQDRHLVQNLAEFGRPFHYGLEAGSKPELMAVMAMLADDKALVICNGYKDEEYIETALLASRLGPQVVIVVEKPAELPLIVAAARKTGVAPRIGVRARLSARGAGHWEASGGDRSKFGLGPRELVEAVELLRQHDLLDSLVLLHFHLGSQISSIRSLKDALREAGWLYVNLVQMGVPLVYLDVGGGLGVDYDGSQTNYESSMNYTLQEYANDVVAGVMEVCDPAGVSHPTLVTESGRATVAHHAVLVAEVVGVGELEVGDIPAELPEDAAPVLHHLAESYRGITTRNVLESYHDVLQYRDECLSLFNLGHLSLAHRVVAEDLFWAACRKIDGLAHELPKMPEELRRLEGALADTYFCNFSVFQSLPDSWAIDHLFPILPIHRLDERPERRGVLVDMTCDSDGRVDKFIDPREVRSVLELHRMRDEAYYLGIFLVGAYQETLGDLHNLFGDTNVVHVALEPGGGYRIEHVVEGDTVWEVLSYLDYPRDLLMTRLRRNAEKAIRGKRMSRDQARELLRIYEGGLAGYTYPERE